jgi:hypothetical protein
MPSPEQSDSGRYNHSDLAGDYGFRPFAEGGLRWVYKGKYLDGERKGQACVSKEFKSGVVFEDDYFKLDIMAIDKALDIANRFNQLNVVDKPVKINVATVWATQADDDDDDDDEWTGPLTLVEPFIQNYQKFNSNTGWVDDGTAWGKVMQALSHFSYHVTGGQYVLCDLQGGIYRREIVLSDPVILSRRREYGVTDLGPVGISSFFSQHACNNYCRPNWSAPAQVVRHYRPVPSTTMIRRDVPTATTRPQRTRCYG